MKNLTRNPIKKLLAVVTFVGATSAGVIAAPRTLANGAPAPGNTVAKGYRKKEITAERYLERAKKRLAKALAEEKEAKQQLVSQPRTLLNGSPACGNTGGKVDECSESYREAVYEVAIERVRAAEKAVRNARTRLHEATRKLALKKQSGDSIAWLVDDDDYS